MFNPDHPPQSATEPDLALGFPVKIDANGIADGLDLAQKLAETALRFVVYYTEGCPACTFGVLGAIFDRAVEGAYHNPDGSLGRPLLADRFAGEGDRTTQEVLHRASMKNALNRLKEENATRGGAAHVEAAA